MHSNAVECSILSRPVSTRAVTDYDGPSKYLRHLERFLSLRNIDQLGPKPRGQFVQFLLLVLTALRVTTFPSPQRHSHKIACFTLGSMHDRYDVAIVENMRFRINEGGGAP